MTNIAHRLCALRVVRLLGAVALVGFASLMTPATPAWAHARLLSSTPSDKATITEAVKEITLTFSDPPKAQFSTVVVTGPDNTALADGGAKAVDRTIVQPVRALPAGVVRVAWRTVSADGHPVEGSFTFTVAPSAATTQTGESSQPGATAVPTKQDDPVIAASAATGELASDNGSTGLKPWMWLLGGGALMLATGVVIVFWRGRRA